MPPDLLSDLTILHKKLQHAMMELIAQKDYQEAERLLYILEEHMLDLIEKQGGKVRQPKSAK